MIILSEDDLIVDEIYEIKTPSSSIIGQYKGKARNIDSLDDALLFKILSSTKEFWIIGNLHRIYFFLNKAMKRTITKLS